MPLALYLAFSLLISSTSISTFFDCWIICFNFSFSCFISAQLEDVSFRDCNLKRVNFSMSRRKGVDFKYSNYEEAIFKEENRQ